jgi:predicted SnoaL-like aldol condensation-catalyzing enzyme
LRQTTTDQNKAVIPQVLSTAFNGKDFTALEKYLHPDFAQHNPMIPGGRDGLRDFVASLPDTVRYEPGLIVAEGDLVVAYSRYSGMTDKPLLSVDIFRFENGLAVEHWDAVQEEVPTEQTTAGLPMFTNPQSDRA